MTNIATNVTLKKNKHKVRFKLWVALKSTNFCGKKKKQIEAVEGSPLSDCICRTKTETTIFENRHFVFNKNNFFGEKNLFILINKNFVFFEKKCFFGNVFFQKQFFKNFTNFLWVENVLKFRKNCKCFYISNMDVFLLLGRKE